MGVSGVVVSGTEGRFTVPVPTGIEKGEVSEYGESSGIDDQGLEVGSETGHVSEVATKSEMGDRETVTVVTVTVISGNGGATGSSISIGAGASRSTLKKSWRAGVAVGVLMWLL